MRIAIIDLGTNSVRFDVHQLGAQGSIRRLHREKLMIRLGQGVFLKGKLDSEAIRRAVQAFVSFHRTCEELHVGKIIAFGTSALREASDADRLLDRIRHRTGIEVRVISGEEEARLISLGVLANERALKGKFALVDIGGGSTEISVCRGREVLHSASFPLGTARLQQVFLKSSPPKTARGEDPLGNLRRQIRGVLLPKMISEGWPKVGTVVGSSGTIRALSRMLRKSMGRDKFDRKNLRRLISRMSSMTTTELLGIPGMEAKRVDMILAGAVLLEECLLATGAREIVPTDYSLRDGILEREIALHRKQSRGAAQFRLSDVEARARRLGANVAHLKQIESLAGTLFDSLRRLHRLDRRWKPYLLAAAVLHDVGEAISPIRHAQHSYYIVKNADFPSMEPWETEFIAQLCLHHKSGRLIKKNAVFAGEKEKKTALLKLLALLRVADALDRAHTSKVRIGKPRLARGKVLIRISGLPSSDLEILRVDQKKALFEELFRRKLVVESTR